MQLTRDGQVVVIHDETLERTTTGRGLVRQHTLAEIRALSAGYPERFGSDFAGERVPTLAEVLGLLRGRARALIEIKPEAVTEDDGGIEALTVAEVCGPGRPGRWRSSPSPSALLRLAEARSRDAPRPHLLQSHRRRDAGGGRATATDLVMPEKGMLSAELVARLQAAGCGWPPGWWTTSRSCGRSPVRPFRGGLEPPGRADRRPRRRPAGLTLFVRSPRLRHASNQPPVATKRGKC